MFQLAFQGGAMKEESRIKQKLPTQARSRVTYDDFESNGSGFGPEGVDSVNTNHVAASGVSIGSLSVSQQKSMMQALIDSYADKFVQHLQGYLGQLSREPAPDAINHVGYVEFASGEPGAPSGFCVGGIKLGHASTEILRNCCLWSSVSGNAAPSYPSTGLGLATFILVTTVESVTNIALLKHPDYILWRP